MYRGKDKICEYRTLTPDSDEAGFDVHVTAKTISEVKGIKLYKVKESVSKAKLRIKTGLMILRYAEFLKALSSESSTLAEQKDYLRYKTERTESSGEYEDLEELLLQEFGLGVDARQLFFDKKTFRLWVESTGVDLDFSDLVNTLVYVASMRTRTSQESLSIQPSVSLEQEKDPGHGQQVSSTNEI